MIPDGGPVCNSLNCAGCCDDAGNCRNGGYLDDTHCPNPNGIDCVDCTTALVGGTCEINVCEAPDGAALCLQTCLGCCDVQGNCKDGFSDTACGQSGATCQDCTTLNSASTCDATESPRVCTGQPTQKCPAPYAGCPAVLQEPAPATQHVCSTSELQNAASACSAGANAVPCSNFFELELNANEPCGICLQTFDFDFVTELGILPCVAPYVSATCNHAGACLADCLDESCYGCIDVASMADCDTQSLAGMCSNYVQADACVTQALDGPAALCNPTTYQGNFGAWLQGVGNRYCGP
ncbi:MAG: hypothetical protein ABSC94_03405 [Polyangiaceae bacterium]